MVASWGASMPAPLAMPPIDQPPPVDDRLLADRVGGHDRLGRVLPPSSRGAAYAASTPASSAAAVVGEPDQAGRADDDVDRADAEVAGDLLGDRVGGLEALGAGVAVGAAGVEDDGADDAVLDDLLAPEDRVGLAAVGGEDGRGGVGRAVVDDEGEVLAAGRLQPGGDAGGAEAGWGG